MDGQVEVDEVRLVESYLVACEERDLERAREYLSDEALLHFPGGVVYRDLEQLNSQARARYRWVRKNRDSYLHWREADPTVAHVISMGTLYGEDVDGNPFQDVRYIDVFRLVASLIVEQHVFNDLAELGIVAARISGPSIQRPLPS